MKSRQGTAARYAKALFSMSTEAGSAEPVGRELEQFGAALTASPELAAMLQRPWIKPGDRQAVATEVAKRAGSGAAVQKAVGLLASRGRMDHMPELLDAYRALVDEAMGRVRASVRTSVALTDEEKRQLTARLGRALGKQVIVEQTVDSSLLGGFVAQVGSLILDGSLDGQLARMRERLARG
jgi:F-type H+-transporting ATPase subunit delta